MFSLFPRFGRTLGVKLDGRFRRRHSHAADHDGSLAGHLDDQRHFAAQPETAQFSDARRERAGYPASMALPPWVSMR